LKHEPPGEIHNVTSHHQQGGITAHTVNLAPQTTVEVVAWQQIHEQDGGFRTQVLLQVENPQASYVLYIRATAPSLERLSITLPGERGHTREIPDVSEPGVAFVTLRLPPPQVPLDVFTRDLENVDFVFEPNGRHPTPALPEDVQVSVWGTA
jgi:hypothetical protein